MIDWISDILENRDVDLKLPSRRLSSKITDYVAQKTADGIFTYMGREETSLRQNPLSLGKMF